MVDGLRLPLAVLRRRSEPRTVVGDVLLDDLRVGDVVVVDGRVALDLEAEARGPDVVVSGTVRAEWTGTCRRCLAEVVGDVDLAVREVLAHDPDGQFGDGSSGDAYPLADDEADLEPVVRDAVLLALPLSPLCGEACDGPDPERFPTRSPTGPDGEPVVEPDGPAGGDPRWAALDVLRDAGQAKADDGS